MGDGVIKVRDKTALDEAVERSRDIFTLPSIYHALLLNIFAILAPYFVFSILERAGFRYLVTSSLFSLTSLLTLLRSAEYFDLRRSLWASFFIISPLSVGILLELLGIPFFSLIYTSILLASLISWSMGRSLRSRLLPLLLITESLLTIGPSIPLLLLSILPLIATYLLGNAISSVVEPVIGTSGFDAVRSLADIVLSDSGSSLEERLAEKGIKGKIRYDVVRMGDNILLTADLHPGPFRMGSHDAPKRIIARLREMGFRPIFLRRACSHERNLASSKLVGEFLDEISRSLKDLGPCCVGEPVFTSSDEFEVSAQRFGETILFTVSGRPLESFEDLPHEIEELLSKEFKYHVSVVDRHDSLRKEWYEVASADSELGRKLIDLLKEVGEAAIEEPCYDRVSIGYAWDSPDWPSVGGGGVSVLSIKTARTVSYLAIDGNNMVPELRDLIQALSPPDVMVVISTTDTHETLSTKRRYNPVGSECSDEKCLREMALYLVKLVKRSLESLEETGVECYRGEKETIFMGSDLMAMLSSLMRSSRIAKPLLAIALLPQLVALLLWI